jgi:hypothetical protein
VSREVIGAQTISRREFTVESVLALLAGVTITITGCGGTDTPTSPSPSTGGSTGAAQDVAGVISDNHGHTAVVTGAAITAANAVTLNIQGQATHNHTVQLTASQVTSIGARQKVAVSSSTDFGHDHTVTFN